jgi:chromosome segregation ATPase
VRLTLQCLALAVTLSPVAFAESPALTSARTSLEQAQQHFRGCKNGKLQLEFATALGRLEAARKTLEKGRREVESARRKLEAARVRIEAGHHAHHESVAEREAREQHYQEALAAQYTAPMHALQPLMEQYTAGITGYAGVMDKYATFCAEPGLTTASARSFVAGLTPSIEALGGTAQQFVASASSAAAGDVATK